MTYEVEINGRTRRVDVDPGEQPNGFVVVVDGQRRGVDVTPVDGALSLILDDGRSYEVSIAEQPPGSGSLTVHVNGRVVAASVGTSRGAWARRGQEGSAAGTGPQRVTAPMPGKVVKLLVKAGDQVTARQGLVVVEAMKMENELRSPRAGTVAEVSVTEGASVDAGALLVVIE
jgi:biotin carboxyl carrier protein